MMDANMPIEDKLILARKRSLRLVRKPNDPNISLIGQDYGLSKDEILPAVRAVYANKPGFPVVFTLWSNLDEINDVGGSEPIGLGRPALLVLHEDDIQRLKGQGINLDITSMSLSPSYSVWYFKMFDFVTEEHILHVITGMIEAEVKSPNSI